MSGLVMTASEWKGTGMSEEDTGHGLGNRLVVMWRVPRCDAVSVVRLFIIFRYIAKRNTTPAKVSIVSVNGLCY
ncbi:hypothetical protein E2C01_074105 [Portunus trituberculatus]|uniref:Uncharacterized protein n=1 Tax=Portunus trituberculatus TaxID=210409 RepID=A0A5B7IBB3_PORTR|nr:hypothetical protein [Portunus trituberculatus]